MNAIGNIFKWFKKDKDNKILIDEDDIDNRSDEINSSHGHSSHRSADLDD